MPVPIPGFVRLCTFSAPLHLFEPPLHHLFTTSAPPPLQLCSSASSPLPTSASSLHLHLHHPRTSAPLPTSVPPLHLHLHLHFCTSLNHLFTTSAPPLHHLCIASSQPLHNLFNTSSPPLHLLCPPSPPLHLLHHCSTSSQVRRLLLRAVVIGSPIILELLRTSHEPWRLYLLLLKLFIGSRSN